MRDGLRIYIWECRAEVKTRFALVLFAISIVVLVALGL
jgi:hypothetical protein